MAIPFDPFKSIPSDLTLQIFSFLDRSSLGRCCQVSRDWNALASSNSVWVHFAKKIFNGEILRTANIKGLLRDIEPQILYSNDEIVGRIQAFIDKVPLGKNARFRCVLSTVQGYQPISLEVKGTQQSEVLDFKEDYFAVKALGNGSLSTPAPLDCPISLHVQCTKSVQVPSTHAFSERIIAYTNPHLGPFEVMLRFPCVPPIMSRDYTMIENRIDQIVREKIDNIDDEASEPSLFAMASGIAFYVYFS